MTDEAALLATLAEHPGDDDTRLVYADWLEERGEVQRAAVLRGIAALARVPFDDDRAVPAARKLLATSAGVVAEWLELVSHPRLEGTVWGLRDEGDRPYFLAFLPGGKLAYRRADDGTAGTWGQVGAAMWFAINDYSSHEGVFTADRLKGDAANDMKMTWRVRGIRLPDGALDGEDGSPPDLPPDLIDSPHVQNDRLPAGAPRPRERITARGVVWWADGKAKAKRARRTGRSRSRRPC
ncbi:MAG: TIGR02996 domain-containing protein [Deltaproteobacteria bacterium]|nr:TIGR02996 domain-containing protein [Deltaproteobacteria bacterium]